MARYANNGVFNVKYPTRKKIQRILQQLISEAGAIDTGAMYDSVRINANIPALGELEIQIVAMYYFGDRKSTRLNSSHSQQSRMPSSA